VKLRFADYFNTIAIPIPADIEPPPIRDWRMLGNDTTSDCVEAGAAHETMVFCTIGGRGTPLFTNRCVLGDYAAVNPEDKSYTGGTDLQTYMAYRQKTGILDASGMRHKIDMYTAIEQGNVDQLLLALHVCGAVGVGVLLPDNADRQFRMNAPWSVQPNAPGRDGHYISLVGFDESCLIFVSWGRLQRATPEWVSAYVDEGVAVLSRERLEAKALTDGDGYKQLLDDFKQVTGVA
jgi:hypothetical protein